MCSCKPTLPAPDAHKHSHIPRDTQRHPPTHTQSHTDTPIDKNTHTHALSHMYLYFSGPVYSSLINQKFPASFLQTFYLLVILELQKSCNDSTERFPITFTQLPLMLTSLHNCGIFLKTMKHQWSTINQTKTSFRFHQLFHQCLFSFPGLNTVYHVAFSCNVFLVSFSL